MKNITLLIALMAAGCGSISTPSGPSPLALPTAAVQQQSNPITAPAPLALTVTLSMPATAIAGEPVQALVSTTGNPVRIVLDCGTGVTASIGNQAFPCTFPAAGTYAVQVTAMEGSLTALASQAVIVSAAPQVVPNPVPQPPLTVYLYAVRVNGSSHDAEWRFTASASRPVDAFGWQFGDGAGTEGASAQAHVYTAEGTYEVRVTAGGVSASKQIVVKF